MNPRWARDFGPFDGVVLTDHQRRTVVPVGDIAIGGSELASQRTGWLWKKNERIGKNALVRLMDVSYGRAV
jgi:hypothetical protein